MLAARSRVLIPVVLAALLPFTASAALVNINTATADELDALPGIGPSKAAAIVQYRTDHGPFASIADIQNVSGIGPSTYADIAPLITVGDAPPADTGAKDAPAASSTPASGGASTYTPPPSALSVDAGPDFAITLDMPVTFLARVKTAGGTTDSAAHVSWSFGDGSSADGNRVEKTYQFAGAYLVRVRAEDGSAQAYDDVRVTVAPAQARIVDISGAGTTVVNDASVPLDLSGWRLSQGGSSFRFPDGTEILPGGSVLFPQTITNLPVAFDAQLAYPNGVVAARYAPVQPEAVPASSTSVQTVGSPTSVSPRAHVQEAIAAPAPEPVATGAGAPLADTAGADVIQAPALSGFLHSSWTYGALGVLVVAGGALLIL